MHPSIQTFAAAVLGAAGLLTIQPATAQGRPTPPEISDQKLDETAAAMLQVFSLRLSYQQQLSVAPAAEQEQLVDEATREIVKAVTDNGLSVQEYAAILALAQNHPALREKLAQRLRLVPK
jgi:hypothetical protein